DRGILFEARHAALAGGGDDLHSARAYERQRGEEGIDHQLYAAAHQVGLRWSASFVGHVHYVNARGALEKLTSEMRGASGARRSVVKLSRVAPGVRDELAERVERRLRIRHQRKLDLDELRYAREVAQRVVGHGLAQQRQNRKRG